MFIASKTEWVHPDDAIDHISTTITFDHYSMIKVFLQKPYVYCKKLQALTLPAGSNILTPGKCTFFGWAEFYRNSTLHRKYVNLLWRSILILVFLDTNHSEMSQLTGKFTCWLVKWFDIAGSVKNLFRKTNLQSVQNIWTVLEATILKRIFSRFTGSCMSQLLCNLQC